MPRSVARHSGGREKANNTAEVDEEMYDAASFELGTDSSEAVETSSDTSGSNTDTEMDILDWSKPDPGARYAFVDENGETVNAEEKNIKASRPTKPSNKATTNAGLNKKSKAKHGKIVPAGNSDTRGTALLPHKEHMRLGKNKDNSSGRALKAAISARDKDRRLEAPKKHYKVTKDQPRSLLVTLKMPMAVAERRSKTKRGQKKDVSGGGGDSAVGLDDEEVKPTLAVNEPVEDWFFG